MDYSKKEFYRRKITEKKLFLERTKVRNQEYEKIIACRTEAENALHDVQHYLQMLKVCSEIIRKENNDFKGKLMNQSSESSSSLASFLNKNVMDTLLSRIG